jgi:hypothetical protein
METSSKAMFIKKLYLYLVCFAALMMIVVSGVSVLSTVFKMTIFTKADNYWSTPYIPGCEGFVEDTPHAVSAVPMVPATTSSTTNTEEYCKKQLEQNKNNRNKIVLLPSSRV